MSFFIEQSFACHLGDRSVATQMGALVAHPPPAPRAPAPSSHQGIFYSTEYSYITATVSVNNSLLTSSSFVNNLYKGACARGSMIAARPSVVAHVRNTWHCPSVAARHCAAAAAHVPFRPL
jgi:hypothetical protein